MYKSIRRSKFPIKFILLIILLIHPPFCHLKYTFLKSDQLPSKKATYIKFSAFFLILFEKIILQTQYIYQSRLEMYLLF